jgi:hypothetical protein
MRAMNPKPTLGGMTKGSHLSGKPTPGDEADNLPVEGELSEYLSRDAKNRTFWSENSNNVRYLVKAQVDEYAQAPRPAEDARRGRGDVTPPGPLVGIRTGETDQAGQDRKPHPRSTRDQAQGAPQRNPS